eukprot:CAMPEP_0113246314 /NCGR_PEP_ID=MMETSP0008_2-20120614/9401_1 /TAXON_ID=97485 /ORGANISM="Prymnesium parvum" /LENGTH=106 /DNA_ID=CAMNT_0000094055 /DNA_START=129 /DNA_END=450 /DNA_ORIENTATION=- /assembly_acc=CAM_ASM_000153
MLALHQSYFRAFKRVLADLVAPLAPAAEFHACIAQSYFRAFKRVLADLVAPLASAALSHACIARKMHSGASCSGMSARRPIPAYAVLSSDRRLDAGLNGAPAAEHR